MVVASIDLMDGQAVQLRQGEDKVLEREDPVALARRFDRFGEVAVIDLDAAKGQGDNRALVREILKVAECRVGGGIRTVEQAKELVSRGARKVIVGSQAFAGDRINHAFLQALSDALSPQRLVVALDARGEEIVTQGWTHPTGLNVFDALDALAPYAAEFLCTCVEREGTMEGLDLDLIQRLCAATDRRITAAGGTGSLEEIRDASDLGADVQLGMALYTGAVDLAEAFVASLNWKEPLLPAIAQDPRGQVLMLGYVNDEALLKAFETGRMTYFSRSRQQLWTKGETSGHTQHLVRLRADCDRDTLLATVRQTGPACHTGAYSCFGAKTFTPEDLYAVIQNRLEKAPPESYTAQLAKDGKLDEKILEEAQEVVEAEAREDVIWEAADVLYFLTVLLAKSDVSLDDVLHELRRRRHA